MNDLVITDLSGGINNNDPPTSVPNDQCIVAENVEFVESNCGERRLGADAVTVSAAFSAKTHTTFLHRHLPNDDPSDAELWALAITPDVSSVLQRKTTAWATVSPIDAIDVTGTNGFRVYGQTFHDKLFLAYKSTEDRMHVWDGTTLRRVGIAEPDTPTAANTGSGTFSGTRYYRVRHLVRDVTTNAITILSEPSEVLTFAPSGTGSGALITNSAAIDNAALWQLEASTDNVNFYKISLLPILSPQVTDSISFATGYATFELSEDVGDYTVPISAKYLSVDNDRLLMAGSWEQPALESRFSWTPVFGDPGYGNDERVPIDTDNFVDLDPTEGGPLTGMSDSIDGYVYVTKQHHIYRAVRTGDRSRAYDVFPLSKEVGALEGSLVEGTDQSGRGCLYFLDMHAGPCRVGYLGLKTCGRDIAATWDTVNVNAETVVCRGVFYPDSRQVRWWVSVNDGDTPTLEIILHVNRTRDSEDGVHYGWSTATGLAATALTACLFSSNVDDDTARNQTLRPFIGIGGAAAGILRLDTGTTDAGTAYVSYVLTKPYVITGFLNKFGVRAGGVIAKAATGVTLFVNLIRDFGLETVVKTALLTPSGSEEHVIKFLDHLDLSGCRVLQLKFGDDVTSVVAPTGTWEINAIALKPRQEESA